MRLMPKQVEKYSAIIVFMMMQFHFVAQVKNAVVFGDHAQHISTIENNVYRVFIDMNGDFYPENIISNDELLGAGQSQLSVWSEAFPEKFKVIASAYKLENTEFSERNYSILQDSIQASIVSSINGIEAAQQTWLIHGFRKKMISENSDNSPAPVEYAICRNRMNKAATDSSTLSYVEVYWDGKYLLKGGAIRMLKIGRLYKKKAIPNAENCGYALRKIFTGLETQQINIITHSTGTYVASSLLFNRTKKDTLATPTQKDIRIVLTASASPGKKLFRNYYKRNTTFDYMNKDNYSLFNFMNEKDEALLKSKVAIKFPKVFGNTTLGCNYHHESDKLKEYFRNHFPNSSYSDGFNKSNERHSFIYYVQSDGFKDVLQFLF